jgi:hypothetical protein
MASLIWSAARRGSGQFQKFYQQEWSAASIGQIMRVIRYGLQILYPYSPASKDAKNQASAYAFYLDWVQGSSELLGASRSIEMVYPE